MAAQYVQYAVARSDLTASPTRIGTTQTLQVTLSSMSRSRVPVKNTYRSLGGMSQTIYHRADTFWKCEHIPATGNAHLQLREFLDSVEAGELWRFDPGDGTGYRRMKIESKGYLYVNCRIA